MKQNNSYINGLSVVPGKYSYTKEEFIKAGQVWLNEGLNENSEDFLLFSRFVENSKIKTRRFALPVEEILTLSGQHNRARYFEELGAELVIDATRNAVKTANIPAEEISAIITTSCSCPLIPALDTLIIDQIGLSRNVKRIPVYQHGCGAGVVGLSLAKTLSHQGPVIFSSVEMCSLVYHSNDRSRAHLVGSAIFGDGAASVVITSETPKNSAHKCSIIDTSSYLIPNTRHLMGYNIEDDGPHLRLDRKLPEHLIHVIPDLIEDFLKQNGTSVEKMPWWLFHPGGTKILGALETTFNLNDNQCHWSRQVLSEIGNMSSATILFVLEKFLREKSWNEGDQALIVGIGPGLTVELVLLQL